MLWVSFPLNDISVLNPSFVQDSIIEAISGARNLQTLKIQVQWIPNGGIQHRGPVFTLQDAMRMMRRTEESKIRTIAIGRFQYTVCSFPWYSSALQQTWFNRFGVRLTG